MKKILVTGGGGSPRGGPVAPIPGGGHRGTIYDICYFGTDHLPKDPRLEVIRGDIRDTGKLAAAFPGHDVVLHLACISNDPSFELDENLSKSINYDCFEPMVVAAKKAG